MMNERPDLMLDDFILPEPENPSGKEEHEPEAGVNSEIFKASIEGNTRLPQRLWGIVTFLGAALLRQPDITMSEFLDMKLNTDQTTHLLKVMYRTHGVHNVELEDRSLVKTEKPNEDPYASDIRRLWFSEQQSTVDKIRKIYNALYPDNAIEGTMFDYRTHAKALDRVFADTDSRQQVLSVLEQMKSVLTNGRALDLSDEARKSFSDRNNYQTATEKLREIDKKLEQLMAERLEPLYPKSVVEAALKDLI